MHVSKENTQKKYAHSLMHSRFHRPSHFGERWEVFVHPSFTFLVSFFFSFVEAQSIIWFSPKNVVVDFDHSLFHYVQACDAFYRFCRILFCSGLFTLFLPSSVLLCNGLLCHRVSGSLFCCVDIVVFYVCIFFLGLNWFEVELDLN